MKLISTLGIFLFGYFGQTSLTDHMQQAAALASLHRMVDDLVGVAVLVVAGSIVHVANTNGVEDVLENLAAAKIDTQISHFGGAL